MADVNYYVCGEMSDWSKCEYCSCDITSTVKARTLPSNLNTFLELKALYECWDTLAAPMLNYLSQETTMSCGLVRYLLKSFVSIEDPKQARQIRTLLEQQASLHPPCRLGMHDFYLSVLFEPIPNPNFENSIFENFFDFIKRIIETSRSYVEEKAHDTVTVVVNTQKDAEEFLKQSLKPAGSSETTLKSHDDCLEPHMFVFNFCVDILKHDFMAQSRSSDGRMPLLFKMVWGPFADDVQDNLHTKDVFRLYATVAPNYRRDVGKYLVLLAEVVRLYDVTAENDFPFYGKKCYEFVSSLATRLRENGTVTFETVDLIKDIPSNWLKCQLSVCILSTQIFSHAIVKNRGRKKFFALFKQD